MTYTVSISSLLAREAFACRRARSSAAFELARPGRPRRDDLRSFDKPFLNVRGARDLDFGTEEWQKLHTELIPGAAGQPHASIDAGHFNQDCKGEELAEILNRFIAGDRC